MTTLPLLTGFGLCCLAAAPVASPASIPPAHEAAVAPAAGTTAQSPEKRSQGSRSSAARKAASGKGDPHPLYPALDLATIPWHTGEGGWGPRVVLEAPTPPDTVRNVTVRSRDEFNRAAAVPGTKITVAEGWAGNTMATIDANDIDVVIPAGVAIGAIELGNWPRKKPIARVRISGQGRMGQYRDFPLASDIILDGISINGDCAFGPGEKNQGLRVESTRIALLNARVISGGYAWLGSAKHVLIANSNLLHGAASRAQVGFPEGWGVRNSAGPVTIVDSHIQGTRYHNVRVHSSGGTGELLYVGRCTLVASAEARTAWLWNNLGHGAWAGQGAILENCEIYAYSGPDCVFTQEISAVNVTWSRVRNNKFFSGGKVDFSQRYLDAQAAAGAKGDHDWSQGNTFASMDRLPEWKGPGDPAEVPLPEGMTLIHGEAPCTGFQDDMGETKGKKKGK